MLVGNIIMGVILFVTYVCAFYAYRTGVPTQVTFRRARTKMIARVVQEFEDRGKPETFRILDLGSGGGQLCRELAQALPGAGITGIEISPFPYFRAAIAKAIFGPKNVKFFRRSFWDFDTNTADVVVLFLTWRVMERMGEKLRRELKPGFLIVVNDDRLRGAWEPVEIILNPVLKFLQSRIYIYRQD